MNSAAPPRLLMVTPYFPPRRGGMENYALSICRGLAGLGWEVTVATSRHERGGDESVERDGIPVHRLARLLKVSNTPVHPLWVARLARVIAACQPDIINAHLPVPGMADLAVRLAGKTPTVITYHNDVVKAGPGKRLSWWLFQKAVGEGTLRRATAIIATSELYARRSQMLRPHLDKVTIIPPGVDVRRFHPGVEAGALGERFHGRDVLLFVGQLDKSHEHKGVGELLRAVGLARPARPGLFCVVAGTGDGVEGHRREAARLGLSGCVEFPGEVSDDDLPRWFRVAKAVVLPSVNDTEGFGMVLLEGAAAGIPAIASDAGGIPCAIVDGKTGILVPRRDPSALAGAILGLLGDEERRAALGAAARLRAVSEFSWELQVERHHRLFLSLLAR